MSKPQIPVTNLKDRIAALEQQRNAGSGQRSASGSPALGASGGGSPSVGGLRDKIAKFEKKGGVPVPRGTFGLGAPPPPEARVTRNGELYGNRIPQPVRMLSAQHTGGSISSQSRSGSSLGFYYADKDDYRRSISMSSVITDLDDRPDYTPLTSPTFNFPDSPQSTVYTPESSPTIPEVQVATKAAVVSRSTSFAQAVEMAKKVAETGGVGEKVQEGAPTPFVLNTAAVKREWEAKERSMSEEKPAIPPTANGKVPASGKPVLVDDVFTFEPAPIATQPTKPTSPLAAPDTSDSTTPVVAIAPVEELPTPTAASEAVKEATLTAEPLALSPPATSPTVTVEPITPVALVAPKNESEVVQPTIHTPEPPTVTPLEDKTAEPALQSPPSGTKKPSSRNNKDLTLNVEALKAQASPPPKIETSQPSPTDDKTPTTATYSHLLSPPPSATPSNISSGSLGSASLISPRPYSMVELSLAERVTPATSRGNVVFIPPSTSTLPRKSDFINYPLTPTEQDTKPSEQSSKEENGDAKPGFTAVVHEKVRDAEAPLPPVTSKAPRTPRKQKHMTLLSLPSPGNPELFSLLQNAVMLESTLEHGELPEEAIRRKEQEEREKKAQILATALEADKAKAEQEEQKKLAFQDKGPSKEEEELSKKAKLRHTFLIPLSKARSQHRKDSTADIEPDPKKASELPALPDLLPSPDAGVASPPLQSAPHPILPPPVPQEPQPQTTEKLRPKSAGVTKSRFSSLRKLGSVKSVIGLGGLSSSASRRSEMSDMSDAASMSSIATPEGSIAHGDVDEFGMAKSYADHGREGSWANTSPRKDRGVSRASTFAGKMFSRSRTKSSGSTLSNTSDASNAASVYTLPPLPDSLSVIPPSPEFDERKPRRSLSMKSLKGALKSRASVDKERAPPIPQIRTEIAQPKVQSPSISSATTSPTSLSSPGPLKSPDYIGYGSMNIPTDRPMSWMSVSSLTSTLPSPLFDKDIFDAFPAVPSATPASSRPFTTFAGSLDQGLQSAALQTPSFDSAFLGSAIHLAGSQKSAMGTPTTATGLSTPLPPLSAATVASTGGSNQRASSTNRF